VYRAAFHPDSRILVTLDRHPAIHLWDRTTRKPLILEGFSGRLVTLPVLSDDARWLFATGTDRGYFWDVGTGKLTATVPLKEGHPMNPEAVSRDGRRLALTGLGRGLAVWDVAKAGYLDTSVQLRESENRFVFSPNAERILMMAGDGTLEV
jgi:WD40 repeat protein